MFRSLVEVKLDIDGRTPLTVEEMIYLVDFYVDSLWVKYFSLTQDLDKDDVKQDIKMKFVKDDYKYLNKYDGTITSKKYYVKNIVNTSMIDMLRKQQPKSKMGRNLSIDDQDEEGLSLGDRIPDTETLDNLEKRELASIVRSFINKLSPNTNSKVRGSSPIMDDMNFSERNVALHLLYGYSPAETAKFFINPFNNQPVSAGSISQMYAVIKKKLKEMMLDDPRMTPYLKEFNPAQV